MVQPINRWITEKISGVKGAPIYKDFGKEDAAAQDKTGLTAQKVKSIGLMLGVSLLSIDEIVLLTFVGAFVILKNPNDIIINDEKTII